MSICAILVIAPAGPEVTSSSRQRNGPPTEHFGRTPITCLAVLGQSILDRRVDELLRLGVSSVTIVAAEDLDGVPLHPRAGLKIHRIAPALDPWSAAEAVAWGYVKHGVGAIFVSRVAAHAEIDFVSLLRCHRQHGRGLTSVNHGNAPLEFWVADAQRVTHAIRAARFGLTQTGTSSEISIYDTTGYVNRLRDVSDLRQLVVDALHGRCALRPVGREVRPGIWCGNGARAHGSARILAPAFLGGGCKVRAGAVITRASSIESDCVIGEETVVDGSSILTNTSLGSGLDVSNVVIDGSSLYPLRYDAVVEIQDSKIAGRTRSIERTHSISVPASDASLVERLLATAWS